jgi:hypothetical protein
MKIVDPVMSGTFGAFSISWFAGATSPVLPVELLSFTTTLQNKNDAHLAWESASEVGFDRYEVEKSVDGSTWKKITEIQGKGDATTGAFYEYADQNLSPNLYYYRLKMVDSDESFEYSGVRSVEVPERETEEYTCSEITINDPQTCLYEISFHGKKMSGTLGIYTALGQRIRRFDVSDSDLVRFYLQTPGVFFVHGVFVDENGKECVVRGKVVCGKS